MTLVPGSTTPSPGSRRYCREREWAGFDPYDALNSELFARTPLAKSRVARLALTQFLKRSPVNFRPLLGIRPHQNPKALGLFLSFYVGACEGGRRGRAPARRDGGAPAPGASFAWNALLVLGVQLSVADADQARADGSRRTSSARRSPPMACSTPTRPGSATSGSRRPSAPASTWPGSCTGSDGRARGVRLSAAGHPGADSQRQLPRRRAALPAGAGHGRRRARSMPPSAPRGTPRRSQRDDGSWAYGTARRSSGWTAFTPGSTCARCSRSARTSAPTSSSRAPKGLRILPGALLHAARRAEVLPRPDLSRLTSTAWRRA